MNLHSFRRTYSVAEALLALLAVLPFATGCDSHSPTQTVSATAADVQAASPRTPPSAVPVQQSETLDPKSFATAGPLVVEQQADIAAERDGRIVNITAHIGDRVRRGQVLALLDDRVLRSVCELQKARIASAQAQVRDWEAEQLSAEADLRRADVMRANKIISEENWEHVKYKLAETIAEVAHFRSEAAAVEADLSTANLQLEQSRITAPFAGVVGRSSVRPAQQVKTGDVLFWITAESPLQVLFTVPETAMAAFSVGKQLELTTADLPALRQTGRIIRVSPVVDPASGSVQVVGAVVRPSRQLKPGMSMQVRLAP